MLIRVNGREGMINKISQETTQLEKRKSRGRGKEERKGKKNHTKEYHQILELWREN